MKLHKTYTPNQIPGYAPAARFPPFKVTQGRRKLEWYRRSGVALAMYLRQWCRRVTFHGRNSDIFLLNGKIFP